MKFKLIFLSLFVGLFSCSISRKVSNTQQNTSVSESKDKTLSDKATVKSNSVDKIDKEKMKQASKNSSSLTDPTNEKPVAKNKKK
jgi:hypothetical protein